MLKLSQIVKKFKAGSSGQPTKTVLKLRLGNWTTINIQRKVADADS